MQCVLDVVVAVDHPCAAPFGSRINDSLVRTRLAECVFYEVARVPNESEDLGAASATSQPDGSLSSHQQRPAMARSSIFYQSVCHSARESLARLANASGRSTVSQRSDTAALRRPSAKARCLGDAQRASPATGTSLAQACRLPRHSQITGESKKHFSPVTAALIVPGPVPETAGYSGSAENFRWWQIGRAAEEDGQRATGADVACRRVLGKLAHANVLEHALTQRCAGTRGGLHVEAPVDERGGLPLASTSQSDGLRTPPRA